MSWNIEKCMGLALALALLGLGACAVPVEDQEADTRSIEQAVKNAPVLPVGAPLGGVVRVEFFDFTENRFRICSGQIIGPNTLLTAAHCAWRAGLSDPEGWWLTQVYRQSYGQQPKQILASSLYAYVKRHPDFKNGSVFKYAHDVAVVYAPYGWSSSVKATDAAVISKGYMHKKNAWILGYGNYDTWDSAYDGQLRGKQEYMYYDTVGPMYHNWANGDEPWLCLGDSGGPLLTMYFNVPLTWGVASNIESVTGACGRWGEWATTEANWQFIADTVGNCKDKGSVLDCWN